MNSMSYSFSERSILKGNGYKPPNSHQWGPGVRDVYAVHYIVSGKGYLKTCHTTFSLKTGESFIIFPHTEVYYYPDPQDPWEYYWIEFNGAEASRLVSMINIAPDHPVVEASPQDFKPLFHIIKAAGIEPFERERSDAGLHLLLSYYMEYYPSEQAFLKKDYVLSAREYIESNFWKSSLSVLDVVGFVKIERSYLFRLFKEENGISISGYLTVFRIQRACELLANSQLSIKSLAYSVGYQDPLYFSKIFKKVTSYTPSQYRKAYSALAK
ncbi:helix-turn-helix domain-containing protein [Paenibacillus crassostreae]|uniref:AraC family transcriptional regulator n=1 Tax=Paenibacillus crassostreae TaxID=1763538 RepID=A0A167FUZ8_9BACL|nr:AraC family transcriptional regulator [Paenibacillus crassostreae]AOZ94032.1 AraC family transcriptional regulator [Paenibacillus crassostreae]OAB76931.1 AraC family transcriptional regulator [Paenibacillus crassostreae]